MPDHDWIVQGEYPTHPHCKPGEKTGIPRFAFHGKSLDHSADFCRKGLGNDEGIESVRVLVLTTRSLPERSRIRIEIDDGSETFRASGGVAYVRVEGMGIAFGLIELKEYAVLTKWLCAAQAKLCSSGTHELTATRGE